MTDIQPLSALEFGFKESVATEPTGPHNYSRIIVPTKGIDISFNSKIAEIFRLSFQDPRDNIILSHIIAQAYAQMGSIYTPSLVTFMGTLQGNAGERGASPGYPQIAGLEFADITQDQWTRFVMEFRHTAMLFHNVVGCYNEYLTFKNLELVFYRYISSGFVFYLVPRRFYDIP